MYLLKSNFSGSVSAANDIDLVSATKLSKISLYKSLVSKTDGTYSTKKLEIGNALTFHQLATLFSLSGFLKATQNYVERCFAIIAETESFSELDFALVLKILASSELYVTTEREVLAAAKKWLKHKFEERCKFGLKLLQKVRLGLLPHKNRLLSECGSLFENSEMYDLLDEAYKNRKLNCKSRYCNQTSFGVLICGGLPCGERRKPLENAKLYSVPGLNLVRALPPMNHKKIMLEARGVCLKGDLYVFAGIPYNGKAKVVVEKYSLATQRWTRVAVMGKYRRQHCLCAFGDKIIVVGGHSNWVATDGKAIGSCLQLDTRSGRFTGAGKMREERYDAACAVFKERVVVCGGTRDNFEMFSTESFAYTGKWRRLPDMTAQRSCHGLVAVRGKLFAVGCFDCDVYHGDLAKGGGWREMIGAPFEFCGALPFGSKFFLFEKYGQRVFSYDVDADEWSVEGKSEEFNKKIKDFSCAKFPFY